LSKEVVFQIFNTNFKKSGCEKVEKSENKLIVKNNPINYFYRILNIWQFISKAELIIEKDKIKYTIDLTFSIIIIAIYFIFVGIIGGFNIETVKVFMIWVILVGLIIYGTIIFRHFLFFRNTLKNKEGFLDYYNWGEIIKNKSTSELMKIINGNTYFPKEKIELVINELKKRSDE
jgi:fatty acid desaturase